MKRILGSLVAVLFSVSVWAQAPQTGSGRYDAQIQQEVTKILQSKDKWKGITASTDDGIVTLQGQAKVLIDSLDASKKVDKVDHVQGVRNHVDVQSNVSDAQLQNGHVTLYGVVDSQMDKQIAETQAKSVPNVFSVDDKLVVAGQGTK